MAKLNKYNIYIKSIPMSVHSVNAQNAANAKKAYRRLTGTKVYDKSLHVRRVLKKR